MEKVKEYGIKYRVIPLGEEKYICLPISLVEGEDKGTIFVTDKGTYSLGFESKSFKNPFVIMKTYALDELEYLYDISGEEDFLKNYFFEERKNTILYIDTSNKGKVHCNEINLDVIHKFNKEFAFVLNKDLPAIVLNEQALEEIRQAKSLKEVELLIERYKTQMINYEKFYQKKGITKVNIVDGKIDSIEVDRNIEKKKAPEPSKKLVENSKDVSYQGLRDYLKERIYGHDEELDTIAQILYMNYTAEKGEAVESILLVGPTGTGKTETIRAASSYLGIPSIETNASNIVPQGIKGMSIEDVISELYERAGQDLEKAQRGLVFLDEFDKLNDSTLDIKSAVKNILLTFTAGGVFPVDNDQHHFTFDSSMTNKIYAGVFDRIHEQHRNIGFGKELTRDNFSESDSEIRRKIVEKHYFTLEELTRISTILGYNDLDREIKRRILLENKYGEFYKKKKRYQRQFGIDMIADETFVDAILDRIERQETGMRSVNNIVKKTLNDAERAILEGEHQGYKKLVLTRDTVESPKKFDLS